MQQMDIKNILQYPHFELQSFIGNATNSKTIQYLHKESCQLITNLTHLQYPPHVSKEVKF